MRAISARRLISASRASSAKRASSASAARRAISARRAASAAWQAASHVGGVGSTTTVAALIVRFTTTSLYTPFASVARTVKV